MSLKVAALYQFVALPDFRDLREPLRALCDGLAIKGTLLLAAEGINGTVAGEASAIDALITEPREGGRQRPGPYQARTRPVFCVLHSNDFGRARKSLCNAKNLSCPAQVVDTFFSKAHS